MLQILNLLEIAKFLLSLTGRSIDSVGSEESSEFSKRSRFSKLSISSRFSRSCWASRRRAPKHYYYLTCSNSSTKCKTSFTRFTSPYVWGTHEAICICTGISSSKHLGVSESTWSSISTEHSSLTGKAEESCSSACSWVSRGSSTYWCEILNSDLTPKI